MLEVTAALDDAEIVERVLDGDVGLFEVIVRRYNQRLYRVAYSVLGDAAEAEDVMQDAYVRAYDKLHQFAGRAAFSTWLTKIAVYEASSRVRKRGRTVSLEPASDDEAGILDRRSSDRPTPEEQLRNTRLRGMLAEAVEALPEIYRVVFVLRDVEGLDTAAAAQCLDISEAAVRVRLHRARRRLRRLIEGRVGREVRHLFEFHLSRCDHVVAGVFARLDPRRPRRD